MKKSISIYLVIVLALQSYAQDMDFIIYDGREERTPLVQSQSFAFNSGVKRYMNNAANISFQDHQLSLSDNVRSDFHSNILINLEYGVIYKYRFYTNLVGGGGLTARREHRSFNLGINAGKYFRILDLERSSFDFLLEYGIGYVAMSRSWMQIDNNDYRINRQEFFDDRIRVYPAARGLYLMPAAGFGYGIKDENGDDFLFFEFKYHLMNFPSQNLGLRFGEFDYEGDFMSTRVAASDSRLNFSLQADQFFSRISWFTIGVRIVLFD